MEIRTSQTDLIRIFQTIGCIGDSLASGEFEYDDNGRKGFWDCYEYSWGKYIERAVGVSVTNFSRGGMTAKEMVLQAEAHTCTKEDVNHLFDKDNLKQAYFIALGVNDIKGEGYHNDQYSAMGDAKTDICPEDYSQNADTIIGWYAKIIQKLQSLQPETRFFLVGIPNDDRRSGVPEYNAQLEEICRVLPHCYYLDLYHKFPAYDGSFRSRYFDGHMNALGYLLTADMIRRLIDEIILENWNDFVYVQFIGSGRVPFSEVKPDVKVNIREC